MRVRKAGSSANSRLKNMGGRLRLIVCLAALLAVLLASPAAHAWDEIQGAVAREAGTCVSWSPARIDCFTRSANSALSWTYRENGTWSAPRDLGGKLAAAPSCVVRGPGGINCYAVSAKGVLATIYLNGAKWSNWSSLGGALEPSRVSCVGLGRDRIACFARGRENQLMSRRWSGGKTWEPWRDLGGTLTADPACMGVGGSRAACFARGARGEFVAYLPDASGSGGGWTTLGGNIEGRPSCVRLGSGEAACAAQSRGGRLHTWRGMPVYGASAGLISSIDDAVTAEPACVLQSGSLVCFLRNARRQLVRRSLGAGVDTSRDGVIADTPTVVAVTCLSLGADGIGCALTDAERRLHYAAGLEADGAESAEAEVDENDAGAWYLSNMHTGEVCRILLGRDLAFGAKRLRIGPRCRRSLALPARPVQWDRDEGGLVFLAADGRVMLRFRAGEDGTWITPWRDAAFLLTRETPPDVGAPLPAARRDEEGPEQPFGRWRVVADDAGVLCTVRLGDAPLGGGFALRWGEGCDDRFAEVNFWAASRGALVFIGPGNVVVARFDSAGPGEWRSHDLGGLTLRR